MQDIKYFWTDVASTAETEALRAEMKKQFELGWEVIYSDMKDMRGADNRSVTRVYHILARYGDAAAAKDTSAKRGRPKKDA